MSDADDNARTPDDKPTELQRLKPGSVRTGPVVAATPPRHSVEAEDRGDPNGGACPDRIGPFRIVRRLGEGGMGVVYLAEQDEPVSRQLAVKVIRAELTTPEAAARFTAERQALARLSHPHIAQMYEAGTTEDGYPYFAMELVTGLPITEYCDCNQMSIEERLGLFVSVCEGVQHAHHRGIIHRDLKPSNILVIEGDGVPAPKIIDFGIAKALDRPLSGITELTGDRVIGTPAYMSPESIGIGDNAVDVDTRSDVYALGVLLFELLSGTRPFDIEGASFAKIVLKIADGDVAAPSVKLRAEPTDVQEVFAGRRRDSREGLIRALRGDLDRVVAKAIARRREDRYNSPIELVADIQRYLSNQPISAIPPSLLYLSGKLVRRHRGAVVAAGLVLLSLLLGITGTSVGLLKARSEADRATQEAATATAVSDFLIELFNLSDPAKDHGNTITARELLDRGSGEIRGRFQDQPLARARFMLIIGQIYRNLGIYEEAELLVKEALQIRGNEAGVSPLVIADAHNILGGVYVDQGRYDEALAAHQRALEILERIAGPDHFTVARSLAGVGLSYNFQGNYQEAEPILQRSLAIREKTLGHEHTDVAHSLNELALLYNNQGLYEQAEPLYRRALAIVEKALGPDHIEVALELNNLALACDSQGRSEEAEPLYRRALEIYEKILGPDHPSLARSLNNLALLYDKLGRYGDAEPLFQRAIDINIASVGPDHPYVGICLNNLAVVYTHQQRYAEAEPLFQRALKIYEESLGTDHPRFARTLFRYAQWHIDQGRLAEAEPLLERAISIQAEKLPADHPKALATRAAYAELLAAAGRQEAAEAIE